MCVYTNVYISLHFINFHWWSIQWCLEPTFITSSLAHFDPGVDVFYFVVSYACISLFNLNVNGMGKMWLLSKIKMEKRHYEEKRQQNTKQYKK